MTHATHTPGPWPWKFTGDGKRIRVGIGLVDGPNGYDVAEVYSDDCPSEEAEANARLIAAAPELLEVLEQCLKRGWMWDNDPELYDAAAKVIRKAKGE